MRSRKLRAGRPARRLPEKENQRNAQQADNYQQSKLIDVGKERSLLLQRLVYEPIGVIVRRNRTNLRGERPLHLRNLIVEHRIILRQLADQQRLVGLRTSRNQRGDCRNANASTQVAEQIRQARCFSHALSGNSRHRKGRHRHENARDGKSTDDNRKDYVNRGDVDRQVAEHIHRERQQSESAADPYAPINLWIRENPAGNDAPQDCTEAARAHDKAGVECSV